MCWVWRDFWENSTWIESFLRGHWFRTPFSLQENARDSHFQLRILSELCNKCTIQASYYLNVMIHQFSFGNRKCMLLSQCTFPSVPAFIFGRRMSWCVTRCDHFTLQSKCALAHCLCATIAVGDVLPVKRVIHEPWCMLLQPTPFLSSFCRLKEFLPASSSKKSEEACLAPAVKLSLSLIFTHWSSLYPSFCQRWGAIYESGTLLEEENGWEGVCGVGICEWFPHFCSLPCIWTSKYVTKETRLHCAQLWLVSILNNSGQGLHDPSLLFLVFCLSSILTSFFFFGLPFAPAPCRQTPLSPVTKCRQPLKSLICPQSREKRAAGGLGFWFKRD